MLWSGTLGDKYESLMVHAADLGEDREDESNTDSDSATLGSRGSESDYEEFRCRKKSREKRKKLEKRKRTVSKKMSEGSKGMRKK
jgi:hypothetical protein